MEKSKRSLGMANGNDGQQEALSSLLCGEKRTGWVLGTSPASVPKLARVWGGWGFGQFTGLISPEVNLHISLETRVSISQVPLKLPF